MSTDDFQFDRNDSISDETFTTPISPLSPLEKSPPPPPLPLLTSVSFPSIIISATTKLNSLEEANESNPVKEMQILIQSSNDLTYPLQDTWTFWYFKNDRTADWKDNLCKLIEVSTVEHFWSVYNHLRSPSQLEQGCDCALFKKHIQPMWEDRFNRSGGRWSLNLNKNQRSNELDNYWLFTLLSLIGDQYEDADYVNGCVVSVRSKGDRISLWTRDWRKMEVTKRIGNRFREVVEIPRTLQLIFESHEDQETKRGASSKIIFRA